MQLKRSNITRRSALRLIALAGSLAFAPEVALADTETDLANAQSRLEDAQAQLELIASEYEALSEEQSHTLDELEVVRQKVKRVVKRISRLESRLSNRQRELSVNVAEEYKDGNHGVVDIILGASTIDDLISNLYYYDKVIEEKTSLIQEIKDTKDDLTIEQGKLEEQQARLEAVSQTQQEQLEAMRDKQYEAQELINGLDEEVRALLAQRDAEILAAQQEAEKARREREDAARLEAEQAAAAAAAAAATTQAGPDVPVTQDLPSTPTSDPADSSAEATASPEEAAPGESLEPDVVEEQSEGTGSAAAVVASCMSTPSPGAGLCAGWCSDVMINAGYGYVPGNANDMYASYCFSSNRADLMPGMAIAVSTHPHTTAGRIYGHIGMYIGDGMMMDNVGYIRTISVDEWCSYYGATVPARWGWLNGIVLT